MRVLIITENLQLGGVPKVALYEATWFKRLGIDVSLLLLENKISPAFYHIVLENGIRVIKSGISKFFGSIKIPGFTYLSLSHLSSSFPQFYNNSDLRAIKACDIILAHATYSLPTALTLSKLFRKKVIFFIHDPSYYILRVVYNKGIPHRLSSLGIFIDEEVCRHATAIILQSHYHIRYFSVCFSKKLKRLYVIYPGCNPSYDIHTILKEKKPFIVFHTKWDATKHIGIMPYVIKSILENLDYRDVTFIISGKWTSLNLLRTFVEGLNKYNVRKYVYITGPLKEKELEHLFRKSIIYIHLRREAFGMGALEAASQGCVPIVHSKSGVAELVTLISDKLTFDHPINIPRIVSEIFDQRTLKQLSTLAWMVAQRFSWERHARSLLKILKECTENKC